MSKTGEVMTAAAVVGCGVLGGVFFAFSTFIMSGLGRLPARQGIAAMQSINVTAVRPAFMLGLFGTAALCAIAVVRALTGRIDRHGSLVLVGALCYLLGAIGLTIVYNVPLNNRLAAMSPDDPNAVTFWHEYLRNWTAANHVRTASCVLAAVLFLLSIGSRHAPAPAADVDPRLQASGARWAAYEAPGATTTPGISAPHPGARAR